MICAQRSSERIQFSAALNRRSDFLAERWKRLRGDRQQ
jgi:hypothetical protein